MILLSIPFMPGVELGLLLMCLFGETGILFVYCCTIGGLTFSYAVGQEIPDRTKQKWFQKVGVDLSTLKSIDLDRPFQKSSQSNPLQMIWNELIQYRSITLILLLNLPGNSLLGGGGGIALLCGMNRQIHWKTFIPTILVAVAPIPLLAYLGVIQIEALMG